MRVCTTENSVHIIILIPHLYGHNIRLQTTEVAVLHTRGTHNFKFHQKAEKLLGATSRGLSWLSCGKQSDRD